MNPFQLSRNTTLLSDAVTEKAVEFACERFRRDMEKTLTDIVKNRNRIILCKKDLGENVCEINETLLAVPPRKAAGGRQPNGVNRPRVKRPPRLPGSPAMNS